LRGTGTPPGAVRVQVSGPLLALGAGRWSVHVSDAGPGWVAPTVEAFVDGNSSARSVLPPVFPGRTESASVTLAPLPPGRHTVSIRVGDTRIQRRVLVLPPGAVGGAAIGAALGLLAGAAGALALRRRPAA
jgi:hypothetical protein